MGYLVAILALIFLIIIHELGHFVAAKLCGVQVNEFALFFGPEIFSWQGKETKYSLRCIPLGGFCAMEGEDSESDNPRAFNRAAKWKRAIIIAAGPIMNIVVALVAIAIVMCSSYFMTNVVDYVQPGSTAEVQGIQPGDVLYSVNGSKVYIASDIEYLTYGQKPETLDVTIIRDGQKINLTLSPNYKRYMMNITVKSDDEGDVTTIVDSVVESGAAHKAGMLAGDRIVAINGVELLDKYALDEVLANSNGQEITVTVERDGQRIDLKLTPSLAIQNTTSAMGIYSFKYEKRNLLNVIPDSIDYLVSSVRTIYLSVVWLINRTVSVTEVSGPVGIVTTVGSIVNTSPTFADKILNLLTVSSLISINLGIFNLLPIPALDGCKLLFIGVSAITRKDVPQKVEGIISLVGFAVLLLIMLLTTAKDIWGLFA